jgi:hypothetical protein
MSISVAIASATVFVDSQRIHIIEGTAWATDSVVVDLHPDMFSDEPTRALGLDIVPPAPEQPSDDVADEDSAAGDDADDEGEGSHEGDAPVEQKTAAPGEKANVRRRRG